VSYSLQADLLEQIDEDILIQLTDDAGAGEVGTGVISRAIADADGDRLVLRRPLRAPLQPGAGHGAQALGGYRHL